MTTMIEGDHLRARDRFCGKFALIESYQSVVFCVDDQGRSLNILDLFCVVFRHMLPQRLPGPFRYAVRARGED